VHAGRSSQTAAWLSKAVVAKKMAISELPQLLAALDRGEFSRQQQQAIRQGVTVRDGDYNCSGLVHELDLHIDDPSPWPVDRGFTDPDGHEENISEDTSLADTVMLAGIAWSQP
jgi:hypothetical protein